jgi:hypothetical protein
MSAPNPRHELATKRDLDGIASKLATKVELAEVRAELETEIQQVQLSVEELRASTSADFAQLRAEMAKLATREDLAKLPTHEDLARHVNAIIESIAPAIRVVDDKYADLPARVSALEQQRRRR